MEENVSHGRTTPAKRACFPLTRTNNVFENSRRCLENNCFNVRGGGEEGEEGEGTADDDDDDDNHNRSALWPSAPDNTAGTPSCAQVERMSSSN